MKFDLYKELLNESDILSHLFLTSLDDIQSKTIADKTFEIFEECDKQVQARVRMVDISLTIEGMEIDPRKFFNLFEEQFEKLVKKAATKIIKEQTSDKLNDLVTKISELQTEVEYAVEDINLKVENLI